MTSVTDPRFLDRLRATPQTIVNADASTKKTVVTAGANGSKVLALTAANDDTIDRLVQVWLTRSGTPYLMGSATVTTLAGTNGVTTPAVDLLSYIPGLPRDGDGQKYLILESGDTLQVSSTTTVVAAKTVTITGIFGDY